MDMKFMRRGALQTIVWKLDFKCNGKTVEGGLSFLQVSLALYGEKTLGRRGWRWKSTSGLLWQARRCMMRARTLVVVVQMENSVCTHQV